VLKLKGHYLAMATLGFGTIIYRIFLGTRIFGEADGISGLRPRWADVLADRSGARLLPAAVAPEGLRMEP
jgi:ABC-type branched-subunit amino acid transport system permease subunit